MRNMIRNHPAKYLTRSKLVASGGISQKSTRPVKARVTLAAPIDQHFYIDFSKVAQRKRK